jgi:hypothetical protein
MPKESFDILIIKSNHNNFKLLTIYVRRLCKCKILQSKLIIICQMKKRI